MRDALEFAAEVIQLIAFLPKRPVLFEQFQEETEKLPELGPLRPIRWTVKTRAFGCLLANYTALQETLNEVARGSGEYSPRKASEMLAVMQKFTNSFGLSLAKLVFGATELLVCPSLSVCCV